MGKSEFTFLQHIIFFSLLRGQHTTSTRCTVLYKSAKLFVTFLFEMRRNDTHTATQSVDSASPCSRNCIANLVGGTLRGWALLFPCVFRKPIALTKPGNFASSSRTRRLLFSSSDEISVGRKSVEFKCPRNLCMDLIHVGMLVVPVSISITYLIYFFSVMVAMVLPFNFKMLSSCHCCLAMCSRSLLFWS